MITTAIILLCLITLYLFRRHKHKLRSIESLKRWACDYPRDFMSFIHGQEGWEVCYQEPEKPKKWIKIARSKDGEDGYYIRYARLTGEKWAIEQLIRDFELHLASLRKIRF